MGSRANGTRHSQGTGFEHNIPKPNFDKPTYNFGEHIFTYLIFVSIRW